MPRQLDRNERYYRFQQGPDAFFNRLLALSDVPKEKVSGRSSEYREGHITVDGAVLWVAEQGNNGPPIMLCTGGPGLCDYMGRVAALMDDIARVYRFDPRGCGLSSVSPPYDLTALLSDLDGLREALGWDKWIIGGHSFGADLALAYTLERSDQTQALVYLSVLASKTTGS